MNPAVRPLFARARSFLVYQARRRIATRRRRPVLFYVLFSFRGKKREPEKKAGNPLGQYRYARPSAALAFTRKNNFAGLFFQKSPAGKNG